MLNKIIYFLITKKNNIIEIVLNIQEEISDFFIINWIYFTIFYIKWERKIVHKMIKFMYFLVYTLIPTLLKYKSLFIKTVLIPVIFLYMGSFIIDIEEVKIFIENINQELKGSLTIIENININEKIKNINTQKEEIENKNIVGVIVILGVLFFFVFFTNNGNNSSDILLIKNK